MSGFSRSRRIIIILSIFLMLNISLPTSFNYEKLMAYAEVLEEGWDKQEAESYELEQVYTGTVMEGVSGERTDVIPKNDCFTDTTERLNDQISENSDDIGGLIVLTEQGEEVNVEVESLNDRPGGIFLTGHDLDYHAYGTTGPRQAILNILDYVTYNKSNPKILLVTDLRNPGGDQIDPRLGLDAAGLIYDVADYGSGTYGVYNLNTVNFLSYDAIIVASDYGGWLRQDELDILNDRYEDILSYINLGGGLIALCQSGNRSSGSYLGTTYNRYGFIPFIKDKTQSINDSGFNYVFTELGREIGLTNDNVGNSHNIFTEAAGFDVVNYSANGNIISLAKRGMYISKQGFSQHKEPGKLEIVSTPITYLAIDQREGESDLIDLSNWQSIKLTNGPDPRWVLDASMTVATQMTNSAPTIFLSNFELSNDIIEGTWRVDTNTDDDFMGFVFGYQDQGRFYLFDWKQADQRFNSYSAQVGMCVKVINTNITLEEGHFWSTAGVGNHIKTLYHNKITYKKFTDYGFALKFQPGFFEITIKEGDTVLDKISINDDTYTSGGFGFYNCSQEMVRYTGFQREVLTRGEYVYKVEAVDSDSSSILTYSLIQAPNTMQIDKNTGEIRWLLTEEDEGEHNVTVRVENNNGLFDTQSFTINVVTDTIPPTAPEELEIIESSDEYVSFKWKESHDNVRVEGYNIYRDSKLIDSTNSSTLSYTDFVEPGAYIYTVLAFDPSNNESQSSNEIIFDCEKPTIPENLIQVESTVTSITLSWSPSSDLTGVKGYDIYRDDTIIESITEEIFTDTNLEPSTKYKYTVRAFDSYGNKSEFSNPLIAQTPDDNESPTSVKNLKISLKTGSSIALTWDPSVDNVGVIGYEIFKEGELIESINSLSFTDTDVTAGTTYQYKVRAVDAAGNYSAFSTGVSATPLNPRIISTEPKDEETVGGTVGRRMEVYFLDSGNMTGSSASFEYSEDGVTWITFEGQVQGPKMRDTNTIYFHSDWNLEHLSSGNYMVRYSVYDADGNTDQRTVSYSVDRTAPDMVENFKAEAHSTGIILTWNVAVEADVSYYNIYRSEEKDGEFDLLKRVDGAKTVSYLDRNVLPERTYYYYICAVDLFNQEGIKSNIVNSTAITDTKAPTVLGISPVDGAKFGVKAQITVRAEDDVALSSITLQYYDDLQDKWIDVNTISTSGVANFVWDNIPLSGEIKVRAMAKDSSGNISDGTPVRTYYVDTKGPEKVTGLNATAYATRILLRWNDVADDDFAYFLVEQKELGDESYKRIGTVNDRLGMNVTNLNTETTYLFRVVAYDVYGNKGTYSDELEVSTMGDTTPPVITSLAPSPGYYKKMIPLKGSASDDVGVLTFVFQISDDTVSWSDIEIIELDGKDKTANVTFNFDISSYTDGSYYIRGVAYDAAGNVSNSKSFVEYRIDHTPPSPPEGLRVENTEGDITIRWDKGKEPDIKHYRVYKSEEENGDYRLVSGNQSSLGYIDRQVEMDKNYYYKVSAIDAAGNESHKAGPIEARLEIDTKIPEIISVSPGNDSKLPANPTIMVLAVDNYKLSRVTLEYNNGDDWVIIGNEELNVYSKVVTFKWDNSHLGNRIYSLRASAVDQSGNVSEYYTINYELKVEPPKAPEINVVPGDWEISLWWTTENQSDLEGFYLYRSNVSGSSYKRIKSLNNTSYVDTLLMPGQSYYYVVEAVDIYGNISRSSEVMAVPRDNDSYPPKANAGEDRSIIVGMEMLFDGRRSSDNDRIESYLWDFGDGTTGTGVTPSHIYTEEGIYEVTLTVFDPAGNSGTDTINVTVHPPKEVGVLEVRVIDDSTGEPISGASVYVDFSDDMPARFTTDTEGKVYVIGNTGNYNIAAYATGYLPADINAHLHQYQSSPTIIRIKKGELVVGNLNVRRMTIAEIVDAGIDINAPENQFVYEFEVSLTFEKTPLPTFRITTNGLGHVLNTPNWDSWEGNPIKTSGVTVYPSVIPHKRPDVPPTIAYLVIPGEVRWLKEFFEVSLTMTNMASPQFIIEEAVVVLDLPQGLSLAPTIDEQSLLVEIGSIEGGETKEAKWIIRGDEKGSYDLKADFSGTLMPFEDPINTTFRTKEPLDVLAGDALHLNIMPQESAYIGEEYYVFFQLTNVSDFPVYNLHFEVDGKVADSSKVHIITKENIESDNVHTIASGDMIEIPVLMPGESIWLDYVTIIDFEGDPSKYYYVLTNSSVKQRNIIIPTTIKTIPSHIYKYRLITNKGRNVQVITEKKDISIIMDSVDQPGNTFITVHDNEQVKTINNVNVLPLYYGVTTLAEVSGQSKVEVNYDITGYERYKNQLRLYQIKNDLIVDITKKVTFGANDNPNIITIEGVVDHFCYFAVGFEGVQEPKRLLEVTVVGDGSVKLNTENISLSSNYKYNHEYGTYIKITAIENYGSEFVYWENVKTGSIISTNPVYETKMVTDESIKAVFYKIETEETNQFNVVFMDRSGRILQATSVLKNSSVISPRAPSMLGYEFVGWDKDFSNVVTNMIISPVFKRIADKYTITIEGGKLLTGAVEGKYQFDMPITVIADEPLEGKKFSHWQQDGMRISTDQKYTLFMPNRNIIMTAVYVDYTEVVDTTPFITLSGNVIVDTNEKTIMFTANRNITKGYSLVESGVILLKSNIELEGELTLGTKNILRGKIKNNSTDQFYVRKLNVEEGDIWYGRAYLIYQDSEGNILTVYSDITAKGEMK